MRLATVLLLAIALTACGDDSSTDAGADLNVGDLASQDLAGADLRMSKINDLAGDDFAGVSCGTMTCAGGEACCIAQGVGASCSASCGDGGIPAACDGPEDCSGGTPSCCGNFDIPVGGAASGQAACTATCAGAALYTMGTGGMITSQLCHNGADCVGYTGIAGSTTRNFDRCCHYNGITIGFCAPSSASAFPGVTCD